MNASVFKVTVSYVNLDEAKLPHTSMNGLSSHLSSQFSDHWINSINSLTRNLDSKSFQSKLMNKDIKTTKTNPQSTHSNNLFPSLINATLSSTVNAKSPVFTSRLNPKSQVLDSETPVLNSKSPVLAVKSPVLKSGFSIKLDDVYPLFDRAVLVLMKRFNKVEATAVYKNYLDSFEMSKSGLHPSASVYEMSAEKTRLDRMLSE